MKSLKACTIQIVISVMISIIWALLPLVEIWSRYSLEGVGICTGVETIDNTFENMAYYLIGVAVFLIIPILALVLLSVSTAISVLKKK